MKHISISAFIILVMLCGLCFNAKAENGLYEEWNYWRTTQLGLEGDSSWNGSPICLRIPDDPDFW